MSGFPVIYFNFLLYYKTDFPYTWGVTLHSFRIYHCTWGVLW